MAERRSVARERNRLAGSPACRMNVVECDCAALLRQPQVLAPGTPWSDDCGTEAYLADDFSNCGWLAQLSYLKFRRHTGIGSATRSPLRRAPAGQGEIAFRLRRLTRKALGDQMLDREPARNRHRPDHFELRYFPQRLIHGIRLIVEKAREES